jgi:hypothetical protein
VKDEKWKCARLYSFQAKSWTGTCIAGRLYDTSSSSSQKTSQQMHSHDTRQTDDIRIHGWATPCYGLLQEQHGHFATRGKVGLPAPRLTDSIWERIRDMLAAKSQHSPADSASSLWISYFSTINIQQREFQATDLTQLTVTGHRFSWATIEDPRTDRTNRELNYGLHVTFLHEALI